MSEKLAVKNNNRSVTLKALLSAPEYQDRFREILGNRAPQFVSSVLSVGSSLGPDCDARSIVASAMTAATLDLPVDRNLGFAWIVPYRRDGTKWAQFQMGYKGYIQLALRTGQYEKMNARAINAEAFKGWDEVGEPIIDWSLVDESKPAAGYAFAFKLVNGFTKTAYWPKSKVEQHANRYSKSYRDGTDSPWKSNFDQMALKTVVKNELSRWGIMSVEMSTALRHDQAVKRTLDSEPEYVDTEVVIESPVIERPKAIAEGKSKTSENSVSEQIRKRLSKLKKTEAELIKVASAFGVIDPDCKSLDTLDSETLSTILDEWETVETLLGVKQ